MHASLESERSKISFPSEIKIFLLNNQWYLILNKGKESENSYQKLKRSRWTGTRKHTRIQNRNISTDTAVFLNQKRANVREHTTKMASLEFLKGSTRDGIGRREDGGKIECKLSEVNTRTVSRGQIELIGEFKIAAGDMISIGG